MQEEKDMSGIKTKSGRRSIAIAVIILGIAAGIAWAGENTFQPLTTELELWPAKLSILSQVEFIDQLISKERITSLTEKDQEHLSIYLYLYVFENKSDTKIRITFAHNRILGSPLFQLEQDFYLTLKPHEKKVVKFYANGKPEVIAAPLVDAWWHEGKKKWFYGGAAGMAFYIPPRNAFFEELP